MIASKSTKIKEWMNFIVSKQIKQYELKNQLMDFVNYQSEKGFPFGELLILHYDMLEKDESEEIYHVAAAIEMLILSFDILDDFEDDDFKDQPWSTDSNLALNGTTALLVLCTKVLSETKFKNKDCAIALLLQYSLQSINGQHKDLLNICRNENDYIDMTIEKSGSLCTLACLIGATLATDDVPCEIERYAKMIGVIGQINNDLMDIKEWDEKNDLLSKKYTLPIIYLLNCEDDELRLVHDYYHNKIDAAEIIENQKLIDKKFLETGAITYTEIVKKTYHNKALNEIKKLNIEQRYYDLLINYIY